MGPFEPREIGNSSSVGRDCCALSAGGTSLPRNPASRQWKVAYRLAASLPSTARAHRGDPGTCATTAVAKSSAGSRSSSEAARASTHARSRGSAQHPNNEDVPVGRRAFPAAGKREVRGESRCGTRQPRVRPQVPTAAPRGGFTHVRAANARLTDVSAATDEQRNGIHEEARLSSISVRGLFDRYDYEIVVPHDQADAPGRLLLLYGDNGSGKTTILRLIWNLLSAADGRGHRTALSETAFRELATHFSDGSSLRARKLNGLLGSFTVTLRRPGIEETVVRYDADADNAIRAKTSWSDPDWTLEGSGRIKILGTGVFADSATKKRLQNDAAEEAYLGFLRSSQINPLFLADDRSLYTDDEEIERAREQRSVELARSLAMHGVQSERASEAVARELRLTIDRVNEFLRTLALSGQNSGSAGANTIYGNLLRQLAQLPIQSAAGDPGAPSASAESLLTELEKRSPDFEDFELVPPFAANEFRELLSAVPSTRQQIAHEILIPYLESLHTRMSALSDAERILRALLTLLNDFLVDKRFIFSPELGLRIVTTDNEALTPTSLSSGERQLVMLLCTTLLARRGSRLFIIDEPELSLGVPWQRKILRALLDLTEGTSLQFLVATHSVEMITSERSSVVRLQR